MPTWADSRQVEQSSQTGTHHPDLIVCAESDARRTYDEHGMGIVDGLNIQFIRNLLTGSGGCSYLDIIDSIFRTSRDFTTAIDLSKIVSGNTTGGLLYVVQLCLAPFTLYPSLCKNCSSFDCSQGQVYATNAQQPIFQGRYKMEVNVRWLLHVVNFFKFHLKAADEGLLSHAYKALDLDQVPQPWIGQIPQTKPQTQPLGAYWKGAHGK
jgi:hypothetical protein